MKVYPAIDLLDGRCVRLQQGDYAKPIIYSHNPVETAVQFADLGLKYLHVVDLNGARGEKLQQQAIVKEIVSNSDLLVQVGGGIRTFDDVESLLNIGVDRVILGSTVITQFEFVHACLQTFGKAKIVLAIDVLSTQNYQVAISGWQKTVTMNLWEVLDVYSNGTVENILCTDIAKDGMLSGPNFTMYEACIEKYSSLCFIASGGISCAEDIQKLRTMGVDSVVIGKAIYEKKVSLSWLQNELFLV